MDVKALWVCLLAGCSLLLYGVRELYLRGDWIAFILGLLIVAFSFSGIYKRKQN